MLSSEYYVCLGMCTGMCVMRGYKFGRTGFAFHFIRAIPAFMLF